MEKEHLKLDYLISGAQLDHFTFSARIDKPLKITKGYLILFNLLTVCERCAQCCSLVLCSTLNTSVAINVVGVTPRAKRAREQATWQSRILS